MNESLDAALHEAHKPVVKPSAKPVVKPAPKVSAKVGAPTVKVDKSGHRVRLRQIDHALEGCISTKEGEIRYRLEPNKWTTVPDAVYTQLRDKFYKPQEFQVIDWNGDLNSPKREARVEGYQEYIIEFPEESDKE